MTAQVMPLNMADMSDEKLADFFFAKAFTDDEPEGEPPTIPKERWQLTPTELEFIRAAASPAERQRKGGRTMVDRWAGICDVSRMAELVRREPALLQSVGPLLIRATVAMRGCAPSTKFLLGPRRPNARLRNGLQLLTRGRLDWDVHRESPPCLRVRCRRRCWSLDPQAPHGVAGQYLTPVLGSSIPQRRRVDNAFVAIRCRPGSEIQGKWRARKYRPAGGGCPRRLRMDSREAPDGARTDRVGRALRRPLRLCLGRPRSRARMCRRLRPSLVCGRSEYDAPALGRPSRVARLCGMAAQTRCRRQR